MQPVAQQNTLQAGSVDRAIQDFRHKGLRQFFETVRTAGIQAPLGLHLLKGSGKGRWSIWVNGNWRLTFAFRDGHVFDLDFEDYH